MYRMNEAKPAVAEQSLVRPEQACKAVQSRVLVIKNSGLTFDVQVEYFNVQVEHLMFGLNI